MHAVITRPDESKHRVTPEELPTLAADFAARVEALEGAETRIAELEAAEKAAARAYDEAAARLSQIRAEAAGRLDAKAPPAPAACCIVPIPFPTIPASCCRGRFSRQHGLHRFFF